MSLLAKASAEGLNISKVKEAVKKACSKRLPSLGYSRPETITKLKCHELAQLIGDDVHRILENVELSEKMKKVMVEDGEGNIEKLIKSRNHANTQVLYACPHNTYFWFNRKKYLKSGNNWLHVSNYNPHEVSGATYKYNTKGFYLYKGLRYDVAKLLGVDLSSTLNEILDEILK